MKNNELHNRLYEDRDWKHRPKPKTLYRRLETINKYPGNSSPLIHFKHILKGDYILFSPINGFSTADSNMKRLFSFQRICDTWCRRYLPIYTVYEGGEIVDIVLAVFPTVQSEDSFARLRDTICRCINSHGFGSYVECKDGLLTLVSKGDTVHYSYTDIYKVLNDYSLERGIELEDDCFHFLNPYPQSEEELRYRTCVKEICLGRSFRNNR